MFEYLRFSLLGNFHVCPFRVAWIVTNKPTGSPNNPNNFQLIWKTLYVIHFWFFSRHFYAFHFEKLQQHCMTCGKFRLTGGATDRQTDRQSIKLTA